MNIVESKTEAQIKLPAKTELESPTFWLSAWQSPLSPSLQLFILWSIHLPVLAISHDEDK